MKFSIVKREPSYFFENIHEDLNRFLKDTFGDIDYLNQEEIKNIYKTFRPALEIKEKDNEYNIKVELPNVAKEDIDVELREDSLSIKAESKFEKCEENENIRTSEFRYGQFSRTIPLDKKINPELAKSKFHNGVLCIKLPKIEQENKEEVKKLTIE